MPRITLKPDVVIRADDLGPIITAAVALLDAEAELTGTIPPAVSPVVIARERLEPLQRAAHAFADLIDPYTTLTIGEPLPVERNTDPAPDAGDKPRTLLERAGYQDGDLDRALLEQAQNPGAQAQR